MTATLPRPTLRPASGRGPKRPPARMIAALVAAAILALVLAYLGQSLLAVGVVAAAVVAVVGAAFLRNDVDLMMPLMIYSMWFEGFGGGGTVLTVGRLVAGLVALIIILRIVTSSWRPPALEPRGWMPVALLTIWAWISGCYAAAIGGAGGWFLQFLTYFLGVAYFLGAIVFQKGPEQIEKLLRRWVWIGVPIAISGLFIYLFLGNRSYGVVGGPNNYAAYIQMLFPLLVVFARRETGGRRWMYWALVPVYIGALMASGSRGGLIGSAVVAVYILVTLPRVAFRRRLVVLGVGVVAMFGVFLLFGIISPDRFSIGAILSSRGTGRLDIWNAGLQVLRSHWIFGLGLGGFSPNAIVYIQNATNTNLQVLQSTTVVEQGGIVAQNLYLQIALDMGVIGLLLYMTVIAATIKNLWDLRRTAWGDMAWAFTGALIGGLAAGMFSSQYNQKFVWLIIGLAASGFVRQRLTPPHGVRTADVQPAEA